MFSSLWVSILFVVLCINSAAQPVLSTKQSLFEFDVYQDQSNKQLYYYSPPDVVLKKDDNGSPAFKLLQMRYTGTHLYSDKDFKGFLNILQLTIILEPLTTAAYDQIKQSLSKNAVLKPLPIKQFHGELIIPLGDAAAANEKYRKVSMGGVESGGESSSGNTFWSERTFTLQLENYEAQLLWDQVETGKLGVSFSYSFYADAMPGMIGDVQTSGTDKKFTEDMKDIPEEAVFDEKVNTYLVKANTFPIHIDVAQFPGCLKKIDINEELPPAYASFEVRCYDFSDNLRPDLFKKIVEIKAFGAAKEYITIKADFNRNKADINSLNARFPYAIRLDQPLEYRVVEINVNGEISTTPWIRRENWSEVIDVTTPEKENKVGKKSLDVELDLDELERKGFVEAKFELKYMLNHKELLQTLGWSEGDEQPMKNILFNYDVDKPIWFRMIYSTQDQEKTISKFRQIDYLEDYLFASIITE